MNRTNSPRILISRRSSVKSSRTRRHGNGGWRSTMTMRDWQSWCDISAQRNRVPIHIPFYALIQSYGSSMESRYIDDHSCSMIKRVVPLLMLKRLVNTLACFTGPA